jgi:hypothetical protein
MIPHEGNFVIQNINVILLLPLPLAHPRAQHHHFALVFVAVVEAGIQLVLFPAGFEP